MKNDQMKNVVKKGASGPFNAVLVYVSVRTNLVPKQIKILYSLVYYSYERYSIYKII